MWLTKKMELFSTLYILLSFSVFYRDGKITAIVVNSSAARNGMLVDHNLLEVRKIRNQAKQIRKIF